MTKEKQRDHILKFTVNGAALTAHVRPHDTLVDILRDKVHLTGTKVGCDMGTCGCCTVHVDGEPRLSCLTLALECQGRSITTIEGINEGQIHPLSKAFAENGGSQCGFCTPGFIMTSAALLKKNSNPTCDQLKDELSGNLCRCTGFIKIYDAVLDAAQKIKEQSDPSKKSQKPTPETLVRK